MVILFIFITELPYELLLPSKLNTSTPLVLFGPSSKCKYYILNQYYSYMLQNYQMDCYFRQSWVDRRLQFSGPLKTLPVSVNILDRLWKPDTHFINGKKSYLHTVTTPNKLLRINQDGRILYSMR